MVPATHENQTRTVGRESQLGDLLTVVFRVARDLRRCEVRGTRQTDIAHTVKIAPPCDRVAPLRSRKLSGEGIVQHLLHGELRARIGCQGKGYRDYCREDA